MKPAAKQTRHRKAFTIVELLTVMSIIVILIGLLVPALNKARRYATYVKQKAQLHSMDAAIELFRNEYGAYPPSTAVDDSPAKTPYCGAMKLCEALMGQDLLGFHSISVFRADGMDATGTVPLYPPNPPVDSLRARKGPYLAAESANAFAMEKIYGTTKVGTYLPRSYVLCDVYERQMASGQKTGMPILYYKANTANNLHDPNIGGGPAIDDAKGNIYNYWDNQNLVLLGKPWEDNATTPHALADVKRFYRNTQNHMISTARQPYRSDEYLLLSAGWDGEYGTADDIFNFDWKYR